LGGVLHVPHGAAVAIGTPANLRYNFDQCIEVYAELARACGLPGDQPADLAERFVQRICDLLERIGLPPQVQPPADAPADLADRLARNAALSTPVPLRLNPRPIDRTALKAVFQELLAQP
jgi:alcohol dehydrogenase